jgi:hypothetical protein
MNVPEVFPAISMDKLYGEVVDNFDVDIAKISDYLKNSGLSNEEIEQLSIHFSAESKQDESGNLVTMGNFEKDEQQINIFYLDQLIKTSKYSDPSKDLAQNELMSKTLVHELEHAVSMKDEIQQERNSDYDKSVDNQIDMVFKKSAIVGTMSSVATASFGLGLRYVTAMGNYSHITIPYSMGAGVLSLIVGTYVMCAFEKRKINDSYWHEVYLNRPEEVRCRNAEEITDTLFVDMVTKAPTECTLEQQKTY